MKYHALRSHFFSMGGCVGGWWLGRWSLGGWWWGGWVGDGVRVVVG